MTDLAHLQALAATLSPLTTWTVGGTAVYVEIDDRHAWLLNALNADRAAWIAATCPAKLLPMLERMEKERDESHGWAVDWHNLVETTATILGLDPAIEYPAAIQGVAARLTTLEAEKKALREALTTAIIAGRHIAPYLKFTISPESPGYHPTMPSAVSAFLSTQETLAALTPATGA